MKAAILILSVLLCAACSSESPDNTAAKVTSKNGYTIYLTKSVSGGVPRKKPSTQFSCTDRIYGVLEIERPGESGTHVLYATWRNPAGEDQERTKYGFQVVNGAARLWVWLQLHRSTAATIATFANPSAGFEEFVGQWEIHLQIDGKMIAKKKFNILC
ncbi:MAG: hypothetical protein WB783_05625 [Arenicellales bacterium]